MQVGSRYEQIRIPEVIGQLRDVLRNLGFPYAEVEVEAKVDTSRVSADVNIVSKAGPQAAIEEIEVEGERSVSDRYVIRESGLKVGDRYSYNEIQQAQRELFNHHLFQFVTISIPQQQQDSTLELLMRVREASLRTVETSIGFGTEELARGQLRWIHRNAFGKGHQFTATGRASFIQQLGSLDYLIPYVYNNKSSFLISPFGEHQLEKSYELYRAGLTNSFIYQHRRNLTGTVSYQITKNRELSQQEDISLPDSTTRYDLSSLQLSGYYSQGYGREQLGWVVQPYAEISGFFGFATFAFQKASVDVRRFTKIGESTMLAARVQAGGIVNASVDSLPRNIRFFLGGTNSVRGWLRQELGPKEATFRSEVVEDPGSGQADTVSTFDRYVPVGGRAMFGFNIELRQEFNKFIEGFGIAAFLDGGQIWRSLSSIGDRGLQFGTGAGLRYRSPIGPLRIDLGYKINPTDQDLGLFEEQDQYGFWDRVGIHFSIGQAF
jgi:outer membrane protein insertion porin family